MKQWSFAMPPNTGIQSSSSFMTYLPVRGFVSYHPTNTRSWLSPSQNISRDHPTRVFLVFLSNRPGFFITIYLIKAVPLDPTPLFFHESRRMTRFLAPKLPEGSYHADPTNPILRYEILINSLSIPLSIPRVQL